MNPSTNSIVFGRQVLRAGVIPNREVFSWTARMKGEVGSGVPLFSNPWKAGLPRWLIGGVL
jgi:hypothetical protein